MIWFTCAKCGKTHGRPENSAGTLVFCECGHGNQVPWESTAAEPPPQVALPLPALPAARVPSTPTLAPLTFGSPGSPAPRDDDAPARRRRGERRDPNYCFNHPSVARSTNCEDCGEALCRTCQLEFQGATLCGPCKNFRVRGLELPPQNSRLAGASMFIALLTGGTLGLCLLPLGGGAGISILSMLALLPQLFALGLGIRALYLCEHDSRAGGQALAVTGVAAAALCIAITVLLNVYALRA